MKKLFILSLFLFTMHTMYSQVSLGPKVGVSFSNFTNTSEGTTGYNSWLVGGAFNWNVTDKFSLGTELYYHQAGAENDDSQNYIYIDYLSIPLQFKYRFTKSLSFYVGPDFGVLLSATANGDNADLLFKDVNISVSPGAQYIFDSGLMIDMRYNAGLSDSGDLIDSKLNSFALSVAYILRF